MKNQLWPVMLVLAMLGSLYAIDYGYNSVGNIVTGAQTADTVAIVSPEAGTISEEMLVNGRLRIQTQIPAAAENCQIGITSTESNGLAERAVNCDTLRNGVSMKIPGNACGKAGETDTCTVTITADGPTDTKVYTIDLTPEETDDTTGTANLLPDGKTITQQDLVNGRLIIQTQVPSTAEDCKIKVESEKNDGLEERTVNCDVLRNGIRMKIPGKICGKIGETDTCKVTIRANENELRDSVEYSIDLTDVTANACTAADLNCQDFPECTTERPITRTCAVVNTCVRNGQTVDKNDAITEERSCIVPNVESIELEPKLGSHKVQQGSALTAQIMLESSANWPNMRFMVTIKKGLAIECLSEATHTIPNSPNTVRTYSVDMTLLARTDECKLQEVGLYDVELKLLGPSSVGEQAILTETIELVVAPTEEQACQANIKTGHRADDVLYCDGEGKFQTQKSGGEICQHDYECLSNFCAEVVNKCMSREDLKNALCSLNIIVC